MEQESTLTIYRMGRPEEIEGISASLDLLREKTHIIVTQKKVPAVVGELAGTATEILLSDPVQALKSAVEIGILLWGIIKAAKNMGKYLRIGKGIVVPLLAAKAHEDVLKDGLPEGAYFDEARVWGPMEAEPTGGFAMDCSIEWDGATSPVAYFMGIAIARPKQRVRMFWYLLGAGGNVCASWTTQTLRERVPEFIRPKPCPED